MIRADIPIEHCRTSCNLQRIRGIEVEIRGADDDVFLCAHSAILNCVPLDPMTARPHVGETRAIVRAIIRAIVDQRAFPVAGCDCPRGPRSGSSFGLDDATASWTEAAPTVAMTVADFGILAEAVSVVVVAHAMFCRPTVAVSRIAADKRVGILNVPAGAAGDEVGGAP